MLDAVRKRWPQVKHLFADGAYDRTALMDRAATLDFVIEVVRRNEQQTGLYRVAPTLGRGAHLRLDGSLASIGPRLRATYRRVRSNDSYRHG